MRLVLPNRWSTREGEVCHEISFTAEDLSRDVTDIVATAAHEVAHLWAYSEGITDVSGNQYHNTRFKERAETLGLHCPGGRRAGVGWGYTEPTPDFVGRISNDLQPDHQVFRLFRLAYQPKAKSRTKMLKWRCACTTVRCATELTAECRGCGASFEQVD